MITDRKTLAACKDAGLRFMRLVLCALLALAMGAGAAFVQTERAQAYAGGLDIYVGYSGGPYYLKRHIDHARLEQMVSGPYQYVYNMSHDGGFTLKKFVGYGITMQQLFSFAQVDPNTVYRLQVGTGDNYIPDDGKAGYQDWSYNELVGAARWYFDGYGDTAKFDYSTGAVLDENALNNTRTQMPSILALRWGSMEYTSDTTQEQLNRTWDSIVANKEDYRLFYGQTSMQDTTPRGSAQDVRAITVVLGGHDGMGTAEIDVKRPQDVNGEEVTEFDIGDDFAIGVNMWAHDSFVAQEALRNGDIEFYTEGDEGVLEVYFDPVTGSYRVKIVGEGTATLRYRFGKSDDPQYVAEGATALTVTGRGSGSGVGDGVGDGQDAGGGNGGTDGSDHDGSADGNGVILGAGTTLTPINLTPKLEVSEGLGQNLAETGEEGGAADEAMEEEILEEDVALAHQNYRLDLDDAELEEPSLDLYELIPPDAGWAAGGMALLGLGGMAQAISFGRAKDPAMRGQREDRTKDVRA